MRVKRMISGILILCLAVIQPFTIQGLTGMGNVRAANTTCTTYEGSNVEAQDYSRWSNPIYSYLSVCADGRLMRVQYGRNLDSLLVEYYDASYNLHDTRNIPQELPIFGAFYETDRYYFLLTGQSNPAESADVEVFRITKYDKNWNWIGSAGLRDCNTTVPFDAGSARMDVNGNTLVIRTCHEMYRSSDGYNHQANVRIEVDIPSMTVTDSYTAVGNLSVGYVSHSFNQFVKIDNGKTVTVDHGDAHPRALILRDSNNTQAKILEFEGEIGENATGAAAGGFEVSDSRYLVAGHSVIQDESNRTRKTRNVFIASVPKGSADTSINWLTTYKEGDGTTTTPQMVKIDNNRFVVLWSRDDKVYYTEVNGQGATVGTTRSLEGHLSDCVPIVYNGKLVWYTWNNGTITFYEIDAGDLSQTHTEVIQNGHQYENTGVVDGQAVLRCSKCGEEKKVLVATSMEIYWNENEGQGYYWPGFSSRKEVGDTLYYWVDKITDGADKKMEVIVSDPEVVSCTRLDDTDGILTMLKPGKVTVTIRPKLNPAFSKTYEIRIKGDSDPQEEIKRIKAGIQVYRDTAVKSSNQKDIEKLVSDIDALLGTDYLYDSEITELNQLKSDCTQLLARIKEIAEQMNQLTETVNRYVAQELEAVEIVQIERTVAEISALQKSGNLTDVEITAMNNLKAKCEDILKAYAEAEEAKRQYIETEMARLTNGMNAFHIETVKSADKEEIEKWGNDISILSEMDGLTEDEITALSQLKAKEESLLGKIQEVADTTGRLTDTVRGYMEVKPESLERSAVEKTIAEIDTLLKTNHLTETERSEMDAWKAKCESLLASMIKPGDINKDGTTNLLDLMLCLNHVSKKNLLEGDAFAAADIDGNKVVNLLDLMRILNYVSKKSVTL